VDFNNWGLTNGLCMMVELNSWFQDIEKGFEYVLT
jgi:hypothetical protein